MSARPRIIAKDEKIVGCVHGVDKGGTAAIVWLGSVYEFVDTDEKLTSAQWAILCVPCFDQFREGDDDTLAHLLVNVFSFNYDVKVDQGAEA